MVNRTILRWKNCIKNVKRCSFRHENVTKYCQRKKKSLGGNKSNYISWKQRRYKKTDLSQLDRKQLSCS